MARIVSREARFETRSARSADEWMRTLGSLYSPPTISMTRSHRFRAEIRSLTVGEVVVCETRATPHRVGRAFLQPTAPRPDTVIGIVQLEGEGYAAQGSRRSVVGHGDIVVFDMAMPHETLYRDEVRLLHFVMPKRLMPRSLIARSAGSRIAADQRANRMATDFFAGIADNLEILSGSGGPRVIHSAVELLETILASDNEADPAAWDGDLLAQVRLYIMQHLADPSLSAELVAREHQVSLRHLQYLFAGEGTTISGLIRSKRLERCRLDMLEPTLANVPIQRIARRWGYLDPTHFGRAFRAAYGVGPREYRAARLSLER